MRIFDSPVPTRSPTRSPTPSTTSPLVERPNTSRAARQFAPFPPGGMNRTEGGVKKHLCTVCNKKFPRPSTLKTHMNTHTGERPHLCPVKGCGHRFTVSSNLRRHIKTHKLPGATAHASRNKPTPAPKEQPGKQRPRVLQERKNFQIWCPESLRGMRNAKNLSSRPPFEMLEEVAPLPTPLHAVQPHGRPGDENYEDRDSFFYAYETDQPSPYHPLVWELHPTLPGPLPSQADCEARACGSHGFGDTLSGSGTWVSDNHRA
ncbi:hypothetical protein OPQ81_009907 [Rhizoctonia solani]|nr:hypothetical protein OPQ81_009907 [Rhizoctonia solani]